MALEADVYKSLYYSYRRVDVRNVEVCVQLYG